ncbi:MAG: hypothetical protein COA69_07130 [Robiginitomaculum sp.]|nr:MAG: hypothetical protein COA69_07130 [Robiginitomaculum sp.]
MKFSDIFEIDDPKDEEWFDPLLTLDTKLFIDPFLIYDNEHDEFLGSHDEIVGLFDDAFSLIAKSDGNKNNRNWKKALNILLFPEVEEICLGYTSAGTNGSGTGLKTAKSIAMGIHAAIQRGRRNFEHFEEVQLFQLGVGPDSISDATANILFKRLADYTKRQCEPHNVKLTKFTFKRCYYSKQEGRWISGTFELPKNPYNNKPILLVPKHYLGKLPSLNADDYWGFCSDNYPDLLAEAFGDDILKKVTKETIIDLANKYPDTREAYLKYLETITKASYDFVKDELGFYKFWEVAHGFVEKYVLSCNAPEDFDTFILSLIENFQNYIENQGGWRLLWNDNGKAKNEATVQALFYMFVKQYCYSNRIVISKEANVGRGPVDFKLSATVDKQALIEVKLARNSKFWKGLSSQLPKYLQAEQIKTGYFLIVLYTEKDFKRLLDLETRTKDISEQLGYDIKSIAVDATKSPLSASLL